MYFSYPTYLVTVLICLDIIGIIQVCIGNESTYTVRIKENIAVGTVICDIFDLIVPRPNKYTLFSVMKNRFFTLKQHDLIVIGEIDRDNDSELCLEKTTDKSCAWKHILMSSDGVHVVLRIVIDDENDNSPTWAVPTTTIEITENLSPLSFQLELPKAQDPDEPPNNTVLYIIDPISKYVYISNVTTAQGLTPHLRLRQSIDREVLSWHNVTVLAIDGGRPRKTGSMALNIRIIDVNDNSPTFESSIYKYSLHRSVKANDKLDLQIRATDADEGANGNITYFLALNSPFIVKNCLRIIPETAVIVARMPLIGQCLSMEYRFSVAASDHGNPTRTVTTDVILTLTSRNIYPPVMQMSNPNTSIQIYENNPPGVLLRTLAVHDKDIGLAGQFRCAVKGNNTRKLSLVSDDVQLRGMTVIQLVVSGVLDRETEAKIQLTLHCKDFGEPSLSSSIDLSLRVLDTNDHAPSFLEAQYHVKMYEENEPYQKLAQLLARDLDEGENARVAYHIGATSHPEIYSMFSIDANGNLIVNKSLDRETFPNGLNFSVIARDHGSPPLQGSTEVRIELMDINDHSPIFESTHYDFSVLEDIDTRHVSQVVGQVTAWDHDLLANALVTYSISHVSPMPFKLDPESGRIYSYSLVDRETQPSYYHFTVFAMDCPGNKLFRKTSQATVSIAVRDYNDNKPVFIYPNEENNKVQLSYFASIGSVVATVKASDKDDGINAMIMYSLVDPDRNILFSINKTSGDLILSTVLTSIHEGIEDLFIRATDRGRPPLTTIQRLIIDIGDYRPPASTINSDNNNSQTDPYLSDQLIYIIVAIVAGTFMICVGLVTGICAMIYRQWAVARDLAAAGVRQYVSEEDESLPQMYLDNYLEMKEVI